MTTENRPTRFPAGVVIAAAIALAFMIAWSAVHWPEASSSRSARLRRPSQPVNGPSSVETERFETDTALSLIHI